MPEKKISIIIPFYNAGETLKDCLNSIFKNHYKDFEVILVNDCSSDASIDIAKKYPCKIINLPERRGPAFARDKGVSSAVGEVVAFLDSDCIAPDNWLSEINKKISEDVMGIGGRYTLPKDTNPLRALVVNYWDLKNILYRKPRELISLSGGNCAFWKTVLLKERKKSELIYCNGRVGGDDTIMCTELAKRGRLIYYPSLSVVHNKKGSLLNSLAQTINLGYSGAIVTVLCGISLIKEPHRFYKSILYLLSLLTLISMIFSLTTKVWPPFLYISILYITTQLPFIFSAAKELPRPIVVLSLPLLVFVSDLLYLYGHLKRLLEVILAGINSIAWHIRIFMNIAAPSALSRIFFFVTKECNASCYFCFNKQHPQAGKKEDLSLKEIEKVTLKIKFLSWLTITGGEPFLRKDIYEICRLFYSNCSTRIISIATNGILTSQIIDTVERILIDCKQLYLTVIVALDDAGKLQDAIKGVKDCGISAQDTLRRLKSLQLRFPRLTLAINTTVIKENANSIEEILDYFSHNLDFDRQCLNILRSAPCTSAAYELIPIHNYLELIKKMTFPIKRAAGFGRLKQRFNREILEYFCHISFKEYEQKKGFSRCLAARKFIVLDNNGAVYACELLREELGNLRTGDYDFKKIVIAEKAKMARTKIRENNCYCQWPCAIASNGYLNLFWYPKILARLMTPPN
ncbi:MAG TPA: glycosyltransferase [Candidatus Margulisiibacteriota bacterium]|nr:glycosyltransferase [Candidatus Margulisiibacteriota bacterium]